MSWLKQASTKKTETAIKEILVRSPDSHDIFTPFELCEEVVSKIPSLDGNILVVANLEFLYTMKMNGVDTENLFFATPDDMKASVAKSIIPENNVIIYNNVITEEDINMKFDVVVGNPPYQNDKAASGRKTATKPLWIKFVELAQTLTSPTGVIAFVTPTTWLSRGTNANKLLQKLNIDYVRVYTKTSPFKSVGTTTSWWITGNNNNTIIEDEFGNSTLFDISTSFFPTKTKDLLTALSIFNKTFECEDKLTVRTSMKFHNEKKHLIRNEADAEYKYPVFHTNTTTKWTNLFDDDLMKKHKVILSKTGSTRKAFVDYNSSMSNLGIAILTNSKQESIILLAILTSKLYKFLLESNRHSSTITTPVFKALPSVDLSRSWINEELYDHFNLTQEEIDLIEETIK